MSAFFRMPNAWHDSLDAILPPIYPVQFMTGSLSSRINRRMVHVLESERVISKREFCTKEGLKMADLHSAIKSCQALIWEDGGKVGIL